MKELNGNILDYVDKNRVVIPTNGFVKKNGECVMGAGLAKQIKELFPDIPQILGKSIEENGNRVSYLRYRLFSFPVKHNWWEKADLTLIEKSAKELSIIIKIVETIIGKDNLGYTYLPRVGCGNGKRKWEEVKPILEKYLDDSFIIVNFCQKGKRNVSTT